MTAECLFKETNKVECPISYTIISPANDTHKGSIKQNVLRGMLWALLLYFVIMIEASKWSIERPKLTIPRRCLDYISLIIESPASWLKFPKWPCALVTNNNLRCCWKTTNTLPKTTNNRARCGLRGLSEVEFKKDERRIILEKYPVLLQRTLSLNIKVQNSCIVNPFSHKTNL